MPTLLSYTTKMPGASLSLPRLITCPTGAKLAKCEGSVCAKCYASKGQYRCNNVKNAQNWRFNLTKTKDFVPIMVGALLSETHQGRVWFRWHDSGDIVGSEYGHKIFDIVEATPAMNHYLPTKERAIIADVLSARPCPRNLVIRISTGMIDEAPIIEDLPKPCCSAMTYTVAAPALAHVCHATTGDKECGTCRACWSKDVLSIAYHLH